MVKVAKEIWGEGINVKTLFSHCFAVVTSQLKLYHTQNYFFMHLSLCTAYFTQGFPYRKKERLPQHSMPSKT